MKKLAALIALGSALSFNAFAQTAAPAAAEKAPTAQQNKMKTCNTDAGDKKGDERKAFMKSCLSAKPAKATTQQDKMKACNADPKAKTLKGDERKAFMKECLSAKAA
ncbi:PsiF family protein [Pseudacidovorax intermedius]|uniref:Phosphate starvation-inducible protein PsiF n=1 Tax=Pseudacidovorax intermedius TaxID=433924 RepID=A0A147H5R8_9BURK|nr:PsiF family protein [Pseudacidovorax intermedius]KTT25232.1 phosphate starvation-inducible protein PsiF [Pseudacidovorax intermedius]